MGKHADAPRNFMSDAEQQAKSSAGAVAQQTQANRPNVSTPFGSTQWSQDRNGNWTMNNSLSPEVQAAQQQMGAMDWGQFGQVGSGDAARDQAITSAFDQAKSRLDPMWQQRESAMQTQLANQGLDPNSQAARAAMGQLGSQRNDAYTSAMASAIAGGNEAGNNVFRNNMMSRQQAISEALRRSSQPMDALRAAQGFAPSTNFMGAQAADPTQYMRAGESQDNANWRNFQFNTASDADAWGQGFSMLQQLAPLLFQLSDERAKTDIVRLHVEAMPGVPFASFRYAGGLDDGQIHTGVIAQDVAKVAPELVRMRADGFLEVNYAFLWS